MNSYTIKMIFAEVAFGLLLIIVHAEAQQLVCISNCTTDSTAEGDLIHYECRADGVAVNAVLTWSYFHHKEWHEIMGVPPQLTQSPAVYRAFTAKAEAPSLVQRSCSVAVGQIFLKRCEIITCVVLHSVRKIATWPLLTVSPGEEITCMAEGNPKPTFRWQRLNSTGKWMDLPDKNGEKIDAELIDGETVDLRCVAENTIRGKKYTEHSAEINVSKHGKIIRIAVIASCCVAALLLIIIFAVLYHKYPEFFNKAINCAGGD